MLTYEDRKKIVKMREDGYTASLIATRFGVTPARVCQLVQVARKFGVKALKPKAAKRVTPKLAERIIEAYRSGRSALDVAHDFGVSTQTVYCLASGRIRYDSPRRKRGVGKKKKGPKRKSGPRAKRAPKTVPEELRKSREEIEYLRAENALLKKLAALAREETE